MAWFEDTVPTLYIVFLEEILGDKSKETMFIQKALLPAARCLLKWKWRGVGDRSGLWEQLGVFWSVDEGLV